MNAEYLIPEDLKSAIEEGRCVAFVGAGFAGAANLPTWESLLTTLAQRSGIDARVRQYIRNRLQARRADCNEEAAQLLQDQLGRETFISGLKEQLCGKTPPDAMQRRLLLLKGIPLRAILTTNFDDLLEGKTPSAEAFRLALHSEHGAQRSLYTNYRRLSSLRGPIVIKLHGDLDLPESVVFSRLDYRKRLYASPAYLGFLRAVFLNYTLLYLGFSFTDAYLNELRSEALAILGSDYYRPTAYAVANDVPQFTRRHFKSVEGIEILSYDSTDGDHSGFDGWLQAIHQATNPVVQFGALLRGKRILWVDPKPESIDHLAYGFFVDAAKQAGHDGCEIHHTADAADALDKLRTQAQHRAYDLVISHWGHAPGKASTAERLLTGIRREDIRVPVVIFSLQQYADERKPVALGLGAQGYYYTNEGLLQAIERILKPGVETG
jgi:hypothetical protein